MTLLAAWPAAAMHARTVVVLDASRSSSRPFDKSTWLEAQKRALDAVFPASRAEGVDLLRLGGPSFTACDTAPRVSHAEAMRLVPQGERGLSAAITDAANRFISVPDGRQLVLLAAGGDECQRELCRELEEWRRQVGLGFVHVVAPEGAKLPSCLGSPTIVHDVDGLIAALASIRQRGERNASVVVETNDAGRYREAKVELYPAGDALPSARGRSLKVLEVMAGLYDIRAMVHDGSIEREGWTRGVTIARERQPVRVVIGPGPARLVVRVRINGQPLVAETRVSVHPAGKREEELVGGWPDDELLVAPGTYDVAATAAGDLLGEHVIWREKVVLTGGQRTEVTLDGVRKTGTLNVCPLSGGSRLVDSSVQLLAPGSRGQSTTTLTPCTDERLPAGRYTVAIERPTALGPVTTHHDGLEVTVDGRTVAAIELPRHGRLVIEWAGALHDDWIVGIVRPGGGAPRDWLMLDEPLEVPAGQWDLCFERSDARPRRTFWRRGVSLGSGETVRLRVAPPPGGRKR